MNNSTQQLKEAAKTFYPETKKMFKSCSFACINVDDFAFRGVWGDFTSLKQAKAALMMWRIAFKGSATLDIVGNKYRASINA